MKDVELDVLRLFIEGRFRVGMSDQIAVISGKPQARVEADLERLRLRGLLATPTLPGWWVSGPGMPGWRPAGSRPLTRPLAVRERGEPCPDLRTVLHKVRSRRMVGDLDRGPYGGEPYYATKEAADCYGGIAPAIRQGQVAHDVCVTDIYCAALKDRPQLAANWFSEDAYRAARPGLGGVPDAVAIEADGSLRAFEYVTDSYDLERLEKFNRECEDINIFAWEIW